ncbi:MAG: diguanylate cyclase [Epsilonproteobacteria bacterium]|nr:diguanylate cyclase [Campylobacterota bacterium]
MIDLLKEKIAESSFLNAFKKMDFSIKSPEEVAKEMDKAFKHKVFKTKENNHCIIGFYLVFSKYREDEEDFVREVMYLVQKKIRKSDKLLRIGDKDFLILLPNTYFSETETVIKRIKKIILDFSIKSEREVNVYFRMYRFTPFTNERELLNNFFTKRSRGE